MLDNLNWNIRPVRKSNINRFAPSNNDPKLWSMIRVPREAQVAANNR